MSSNLLYESYVKPIDWKPERTAKWDPKKLADSLGLNFDLGAIESKFNDATKSQYDALKGEYANTENAYYRNMYNTQNSSIDAIRKSNASAVATGASRGMQAANELSSVLGMQQTSQEGAMELANARNDLYTKEQADYKANVVEALKNYQAQQQALGTLGANIYASDTQFDVGQMDYYAQLEQSMKALMAAQEQAAANRYGADKNLEGVKYQADAASRASSYSYGSGGSGGGSSSGSSKSSTSSGKKVTNPSPKNPIKDLDSGNPFEASGKPKTSSSSKKPSIPDKKGQNASNRFTKKSSGRKR